MVKANTRPVGRHHTTGAWSGVAKWGGLRMKDILDIVRPLPSARWVVFYSFQNGRPIPGGITTATGSSTCASRWPFWRMR
jgi:DMSO/TMAO reductase YedYZ molybdopterin-dependent catalytic subunit